jgi:hypothetical protein
MASLSVWTLLIATVLVAVAGGHTRRLARYLRAGELHVLTSAGGDGIVGHVARSGSPVLFWLLWIGKAGLLLGLVVGVLYGIFFA